MKKSVFLFFLILIAGFACKQVTTSDHDLTTWPEEKSPEVIGKQIALKFIDTPHTYFGRLTEPNPGHITYPDVCTWLGGLWFSKVTDDKELFKLFEDRFTPLFNEEKHLQPLAFHVDNNVFGSVPLELYLQTGEEKYLDLGLYYADTQWEVPDTATEEEKEWADKGYTWQTRLWIDDMFMITAVQTQAYRATQDPEYINRTAREMVLYLEELQLENGLFYHSPEAHFHWGRGNGWMAVGMAEILRALPEDNPDRERILKGYHEMMAALLKFQAEDGMWRQLINDEEAWKETSSTGMFTYSMVTGVKNGWLDEKTYGAAARKAWLALTGYINEDGLLTEVCAGTNIKNDRDHYMNRPRIVGDLHGHAPLLWCATALLRD
jgi:rhamnogalacturonyl hydrolase YesR